jgi:hypothetical protein
VSFGSSAQTVAVTGKQTKITRVSFTDRIFRLTRIRLHLAIYFCLHKGKFAGKYGKLATLVKKSGQKRHKEQVERERIRYHLQPRKRTKGE